MQKKDSQESAHICIIDTTFEKVGKGKTTILKLSASLKILPMSINQEMANTAILNKH